jgi:GNAT superfamily N-acetyltransferase
MKPCYVNTKFRCIADTFPLNDGTWMISRVNVPAKHRGLGLGTALLKEVLADADAEGIMLELCIEPSDGLDFEELHAWYSRYGFRDTDLRGHMRRLPCES